jgi:eukaryotic-like serine/threonine-protein kinase
MNAERWQKVKNIFDKAVELAPAERKVFIDEACESDDGLRSDVEGLLESFDDSESFLERPAAAEVASVIVEPKDLEAGKSFGRYKIIELLGAGGMGEVYLAEDSTLGRRVAIKILNEKFAKNESNLKRFTQEAKAASGLNHPNILVIHEIGEHDDTNYIVSEFIEGKTLRDSFEDAPLRLSEMLDTAIQIAGALAAAHAAGIVHRDVKPENIMVRPDGYAKILDFGLAKLVEQKAVGLEDATVQQNQTAKGVILGTVNYMSPEQAKGEPVDERTDIFSFGVVLYEIVAGRTPFGGASMSETFANLINIEPQPLSRFAANVPDELVRIVSKTLRKDKEERYQTMRDLLADLKTLRENLAFDERLERTRGGSQATSHLPTATGDSNQKTGETNYNSIAGPTRGKLIPVSVAVAVLAAVFVLGYYFWTPSSSTGPFSPKMRSLAVLPFVNASQDPNADYLSDGITESIINNLSQIGGLRVMSRSSAFRFRDNQTDISNIASELAVESVVTGDIKQVGDKLVINVRLINASDDSQIWGNQYVKTSADIIAVQDEISRTVAQNLRLKLTNSEQQQLGKDYTKSIEAYQLYLRGRYHYFKLTEPEMRKAIDLYQQAIDVDPSYALAYAGMADAYRTLPIAGTKMTAKEAMPQAKAAARRALEIDQNLAEAHITMGWVGFFYDWDWGAAESELKRAIELAPNNADAHRAYAHMLSNSGRHEEAISEGKRARELDPLSLITNALEGQFLLYAGRSEEAIARLRKTLEIEPNFWAAYNGLARVYIHQGRFEEAIVELNNAKELSAGSTEPITQLGFALAKSGNRERAQATIAELKLLAAKQYVPAYSFAVIHIGLGDAEEALNYLERSFQERESQLSFIKIDGRWDDLRPDPRFHDLLRRVGFPQ